MSNQDQSKYVVDLNELDVLCGRGSGPNDRTGNIAFRNLVLTRKAEYLAAKTRDVKGRIASEIVNNVRERGGRFLKKLTPAQAKDAGFKRGLAVYELADEPTVLEKAKQTLRQNRAAFQKQHQDEHGDDDEGGEDENNPLGDFDALQTNFHDQAGQFMAAQSNNFNMSMCHPAASSNSMGRSSNGMNLNPIPLNEMSGLLDSDRLPQLGSIDARRLQNALFASSSISSKDANDQMKLSMDLSMLLGSNNSGGRMSDVSSEGFGSLMNELGVSDRESMKQQYKALQDQQHQALMNQYDIIKRQHEHMMQSMYPQFSQGNEMNMRDNNFQPQCQQNFPSQNPQSFNPQYNALNSNEMNVNGLNIPPQAGFPKGSSVSSSTETSVMNNFSEDSLSRHHNALNGSGASSDVFRSLLRQYSEDPNQYQQNQFSTTAQTPQLSNTTPTLSTNEILQGIQFSNNSKQPSHCSNEFSNAKQTSHSSNEISRSSKESNTTFGSTVSEFSQLSRDPVIAQTLGTIARQQEFDDQQKLLQQYQSLQSSTANQISEPSSCQDTNISFGQACQDAFTAVSQGNDTRVNDDDGIVKLIQASQDTFDTDQKRPARRSRKHTQQQDTDQSLTLSFVTGKSLASKINDDPMHMSEASSKSKSSSSKTNEGPRDSSMLSLMSMSVSLSEISTDLLGKNPGESLVSRASVEKSDTIHEGDKEDKSSQELELYNMSLASLGEGWALDENDRGGGGNHG